MNPETERKLKDYLSRFDPDITPLAVDVENRYEDENKIPVYVVESGGLPDDQLQKFAVKEADLDGDWECLSANNILFVLATNPDIEGRDVFRMAWHIGLNVEASPAEVIVKSDLL